MTKYQLMKALLDGGTLSIEGVRLGSVCSVEREDGSGHSWNVTGYIASHTRGRLFDKTTLHVYTID
jgi:hypothetical protein